MPKRKLEFEDERRWPVQNIPLKEISRDSKVQPRERIDPSVVADYQERLQEGDVFPPVVVFRIDKKNLLVSGYHRFEAATLAGEKIIRCEVREGTLRDAILYSAACNATHGLRRTWADKRKAVGILLGDAEWRKWSDRDIARQCKVSPTFVAGLRRDLTANACSDERRYMTKHGTEGTMNITAIGRPPPAPSVSLLTATDDERQAEIVRIGEVLEGKRGEFIVALAQIEKALLAQSGQLLRSNPSADVALAGRMKAVAQRLLELSKSITTRAAG